MPAVEPGELIYGLANGIINVFPQYSLPQLCRGNITTSYQSVIALFVDWNYVWPADDLKIMTDVQNLMKLPYGAMFNCYFFVYNTWVAVNDPLEDGVISPDEALALSTLLVNDWATNVLFNMGYMYNDVRMFLTLPANEVKYWQKIGLYAGDFLIRFFYRKSFLSQFEF